MAGHDALIAGGTIALVLVALALAYVILWPLFLLAAFRRMAKAQEALASAFTNAPGEKDVAESLAAYRLEFAMMAESMALQARALDSLAKSIAAQQVRRDAEPAGIPVLHVD